ncbi:MAG: flippase-like domain-containing protein [Acidilobaceae archaeon]|nr:flippase-like domain-containing protein [Acidilobaceae archaeon]MCX8165181.1 flippase-like domain-containing protein [Acidilobaceae archaeon]MDW7974303.1 flippase-like domain-containing protein [Sulfolobales archaeon]
MLVETLDVLSRASASLLILAIAIYSLSICLAGLRWTIATRAPLSKAWVFVEALLVGTFVNNVLSFSGAAGEVGRVGWAKLRTDVPLHRLVAGALAERALDFLMGALYFLLAAQFLKTLLPALLLRRGGSQVVQAVRAAKEVASEPRLFLLILLLSAAIWLLDSLRLLLISLSFGAQISFLLAVTLTLIGVLARFTPVPAGLGFMEGGFAGAMIAYGLSVGEAASIIVAERFISTLLPSLVGGLLVAYRGGLSTLKAVTRGGSLEDSLRN